MNRRAFFFCGETLPGYSLRRKGYWATTSRLPLYSKGPEVLVARDGIDATALFQLLTAPEERLKEAEFDLIAE